MTNRAAPRRLSDGLAGVGVVAALAATAALVLPWVSLGKRHLSSIDLVATASAFEVVTGLRKGLVLAAWMLLPTLTAIGLILASLRHHRWLAATLAPFGVLYAAILVAMPENLPLRFEWGLWFGLGSGILATIVAVGLLVVS